MNVLYPLKFKPIFLEKIWGGQNVKSLLHKDFGKLMNCGEMWLLSGVEGQNSIVANGQFEGDEINDLVETFMGDAAYEDQGERLKMFCDYFASSVKYKYLGCENLRVFD